MLRYIREKKAQAALEYIVMITIIVMAIFIFQKYILRGMAGKWKTTGDSFGYGRQYDPKRTLECKFDYIYTDSWYSVERFEANDCFSVCGKATSQPATCRQCIESSQIEECNE